MLKELFKHPASAHVAKAMTFVLAILCVHTPVLAEDFSCTVELGHILNFTILDKENKTVETKAGYDAPSSQDRPVDGNHTYYGDIYAISLKIPATVTHNDVTYTVVKIGDYSFCHQYIRYIDIPESVTSIGKYAFYMNAGLKSIIIPTSIKHIGEGAFNQNGTPPIKVYISDITKWLEIDFEDKYSNPFNMGGYTYTDDNSGSIKERPTLYLNKKKVSWLSIPNNITEIKKYAFYGMIPITISIPPSVRKIGEGGLSFYGIDRASATLNIEDLSAWWNVEIASPYSLCDHRYLNRVEGIFTIYRKNWYINQKPLSNAELIIPESVTRVYPNLFAGADCIKTVTGHSGLKEIGNGAFFGCLNLESVKNVENLSEIGDSTFCYCTSLTSIENSDNLTKIGKSAFNRCSNIEAIANLKSLTDIPDFAFYDCKKLRSVDISNKIKSIGESAFQSCSALDFFYLPEKIDLIGANAFADCSVLNIRNIRSSIIGNGAFMNCAKLKPYTISSNTLGDNAFANCTGLNPQDISSSIIGNHTFENCTSLSPNTISTKRVGESAFENCTSLKSTAIPDSIEYIGDSGFKNCTALNQIVLQAEYVGQYAFRGCENLTNVHIRNKTKEIGYGAFFGCELSSLYIEKGDTPISIGRNYWGVYSRCSTAIIDRECLGSDFRGAHTLVVGNNVTYLPENAAKCNNAYIGYNIQEFGLNAIFDSQFSLHITAENPPKAAYNCFEGMSNWVYVMPESVALYENSSTYWYKHEYASLICPSYLTLDTDYIEAEPGEQFKINYTLDEATIPYVLVYSTDNSVATVTLDGLVTMNPNAPVGSSCDIVFESLYPGISAKCRINHKAMSGVDEIAIDSPETGKATPLYNNDIYTIQGVCLKRNATPKDLEALSPGFYIVGGKKYLVK